MMYEKISHFKDSKIKRKVGIPRILFEILTEIVQAALIKKHEKGGRPPKLTAENLLVMFLTYYRDYPTYLSLSVQFGLHDVIVGDGLNG